MSLQRTTCQALGGDVVGLARWLRQCLEDGESVQAVLDMAQALDLHPLSLALCPPLGHSNEKSFRAENRKVAKALGLDEPWMNAIQQGGLRLRGLWTHALPENLVTERLSLNGLKHPVDIPENTFTPYLLIYQCHQVQRPPKLRGVVHLKLSDIHGMREIPEDLEVIELRVASSKVMEVLRPCKTQFLSISSCPQFRRIDEGVIFEHLELRNLPLLEPSPMLIRAIEEGNVSLDRCPQLEHLIPG